MGFTDKLRMADQLIQEKKVRVNFFNKHRRYLVHINDLICFTSLFLKIRNLKRFKKIS